MGDIAANLRIEKMLYFLNECGYLKNEKFPVVTVIGSTKFKDEFIKVNKLLASVGCIVLTCHLFSHSGDNDIVTDDVKKRLDKMHFQMIEMSDFVYVINKDGYIGLSTLDELLYAASLHKTIMFHRNNFDNECFNLLYGICKAEYLNN